MSGLDLLNLINKSEQEEFQGKKFTVENGSIRVNDPEVRAMIDKIKLSPSMIGGFIASPGDWVVSKYIEPHISRSEPVHLTRGNWFHLIMEKFFALPQEERTWENLGSIVKNVTAAEYPQMNTNENKDWLRAAMINYKNNGLENAQNEKVAKIYLQGELKTGLELFVRGSIGNAKRQCLGFIDRLIEGKNGLKVEDWKTGKKVSTYNPEFPISDKNPFDYWRQQLFYTLLLEQAGMTVEEASLIFPVANQKVYVDVNNQGAREQVIKDVEAVDSELTKCIENDYTFPFRKGQYTTWAYYLGGLGSVKYPPDIHTDLLYEMVEVIK